ncbi:chaperone protein dnaJ 20, chloroplastic [Manihot esculenta]|uniref:J domain-containing protein n=1 Tax=Manihot esculenta TaxID=3983 RepID=A0A2C9UUX7_MANES|nr:chaperone protein dnaJ 20, chloroplastic [Manihot esculenta]OAY34807.1 hypothetical protein MANES_12G049100v8 [Manihot esculenta]
MSSGIISNGIHASFPTISNPKLSTHKSFLQPSSHLSFNTHFQKSSFTIKTKPIKVSAAAVDSSFYVNSGSFYDLLGIPKSGTLSEIKKAYKQLARKYHPDVSPPECKEEYTKRFLQVQEAYETLSDPKSRALYDRDMDRGLDLHTIFSTTKRSRYSEGLDAVDDWKQRWQSQLTELIRMSNVKDLENLSWGARMRRQASYCH